jgi:hypothetical protein
MAFAINEIAVARGTVTADSLETLEFSSRFRIWSHTPGGSASFVVIYAKAFNTRYA